MSFPHIEAFRWMYGIFNPNTYVEGMSDAEIMCEVTKKLNEVIGVCNSVSEAQTKLEEYVRGYFANLDISEEVQKKLNEMEADGSLADIIEGQLFTEFNVRMDKVEEKANTNASDIAALQEQVGNINGTTITAINQKISDLQEKDRSHDASLNELNRGVGNNALSISQLQELTNTMKNRGYIYSSDYGVVANGSDMQEKLYAFFKAGAGKAVCVIEPGIYTVNNPVRIPSNSYILGLNATIKMKANANQTVILMNDANGVAGGYGANSNIRIEGLTLNANFGVCGGIAIGHASDVVIYKCKFINNMGWHCIEINGSQNVIVKECNFSNYGLTESGDAYSGANEMLQLDYASSAGVFPFFGPYDETYDRNILITECRFTGAGTDAKATYNGDGIGGHTLGNGKEPHQIYITNNYFTGLKHGIKLPMAIGIVIEGNTMDYCAWGIRMENGRTAYATIANNTLYGAESENVSGRGIYVGAYPNVETYKGGYQVAITGNTVNGFKSHGISANGKNQVISGNVITGCGEAGIYVGYQQTNVVVANNVVKDNNKKSSHADLYIRYVTPCADVNIVGNTVGRVNVNVANKTIAILNNIIDSANDMSGCETHANLVGSTWKA